MRLSPFRLILFALYLALIISTLLYEISDEFFHGKYTLSEIHSLAELLAMVMTLSGLIYLIFAARKQWKEQQQLKQSIADLQAKLTASSERLKSGKKDFIQLINWQFGEWRLSPSEKEVGMLLLKGMSFSDIANIRNTANKTVRTQATAIYQKSGLKGRNELTARFLEDLLG